MWHQTSHPTFLCHGVLNSKSFPDGLVVKNLPTNAGNTGDAGSIPGSGRFPGGGNGNPLPVFLPGKSHGQRSLAGYIQSMCCNMPQSKLWYNRSKRIVSQVMLWKWAPKSTMFLKKFFFSCSRGISSFLTRDRICSSHPPVLGAQSQPTGPPGHPCFLILSVSTRLPRTCQSSWLWSCWDCPGLWGKEGAQA